jgi:hypothetical protein
METLLKPPMTLIDRINQADLSQLTYLLDEVAEALNTLTPDEADWLIRVTARRVGFHRVKMSLANTKMKQLEARHLEILATK